MCDTLPPSPPLRVSRMTRINEIRNLNVIDPIGLCKQILYTHYFLFGTPYNRVLVHQDEKPCTNFQPIGLLLREGFLGTLIRIVSEGGHIRIILEPNSHRIASFQYL
jgi:hypothetical protein